MAMRYRAKFPLAVGATTAVMTGMYLLIGCVGYARLGQNFDHSKPVSAQSTLHPKPVTAQSTLHQKECRC